MYVPETPVASRQGGPPIRPEPPPIFPDDFESADNGAW